jgi:hypothetical protein
LRTALPWFGRGTAFHRTSRRFGVVASAVTVMPDGAAGTKSALICADCADCADCPTAFTALTENRYDAVGSRPVTVQTVAVPQSFAMPFVPVTR